VIETSSSPLKKTPVFEWHLASGARMVDFSGWQMPLQYTGIIEEHKATRTKAGLFDVSHMGEIEIRGEGAFAFLQYVLTRDLSSLRPGQMKLALILNDQGGIKDDVTVYAIKADFYRLVTNASTKEKILNWLSQVKEKGGYGNVEIQDVSDEIGKIDVQGPLATEIIKDMGGENCVGMPHYRFTTARLASFETLISRSGYTGEDGFEIYVSSTDTLALWEKIVAAGRPYGLLPAGLGARDTLRLEAGMMLYGHEIDESVNPFEVVYAWAVDMGKEFLGKAALSRLIERGLIRKLVGFAMKGRGIARHGYAVCKGEVKVGEVTSGTYAPTCGGAIGMAFVPLNFAREGEELEIDIRGNPVPAQVVKLPFYRRK